MLDCKAFYEALVSRGVSFFAGVPDSLLKDICAYITAESDASRHVITANEGSAVALASGHTMATGELGLVYMQNSGLGNAVNPLTSLADPDVYGIPMVLMIGWRGEPGAKKDEPQHVKMGKVTLALLDALGIPHAVLPDTLEAALLVLDHAVQEAKSREAPFALVVRDGTFDAYKLPARPEAYTMSREHAIGVFLDGVPADGLIVSTTGKPSRELYEQREKRGEPHDTDFLTVGAMGHASQIALGVALRAPERPVYVLDGDGAILMQMGGLATIGALRPANYKHFVVNNGAHESVGGQPTVAFGMDLQSLARACGYAETWRADTEAELRAGLEKLKAAKGPALLEARVTLGARKDLGRPKMTPRDLKKAFMGAITKKA